MLEELKSIQRMESKERSGKMMDKPASAIREALTMLRKVSIVRLKANGYCCVLPGRSSRKKALR